MTRNESIITGESKTSEQATQCNENTMMKNSHINDDFQLKQPPRNENNNEFRCARLCEFEYTKLSHYQEHCYYNAPIIILLYLATSRWEERESRTHQYTHAHMQTFAAHTQTHTTLCVHLFFGQQHTCRTVLCCRFFHRYSY